MGAFQTGFQMGSSIYQRSLDNQDREERRKAEAEERALRLEAVRLGLDESRGRLAQQRELADLRRTMRDEAAGIDRAGTDAALDADFEAELAASDRRVKQEAVARAQGRGVDAALRMSSDAGVPGAGAPPIAMPAAVASRSMAIDAARRQPPEVGLPSVAAQSFPVSSLTDEVANPTPPVTIGVPGAPAASASTPAAPAAPVRSLVRSMSSNAAPVLPAAPAAAPAAPAQTAAPALPAAAAAPAAGKPAVRLSNADNEARLTRRKAVDPADYGQRIAQMNRQLEYALASGDMQSARTLQQEMRTLAEDGVWSQAYKAYDGSAQQISDAMAGINRNSRSLTLGKPDKNGMVRLSVVDPDSGEGSFAKLNRNDQAQLYAASALMALNPTRALEMIGKVNESLAKAVAAENGLTAQLAANANDVAGKSSNITLNRNQDARAEAQEGRAAGKDKREQADTKAQREALAELEAANQAGDAQAVNAARLAAVKAGLKLEDGGDKNAPAEVKLARAALAARIPGIDSMAAALQWARTNRSKSPQEWWGDVYQSALRANMGNAEQAKKAADAFLVDFNKQNAAAASQASGAAGARGAGNAAPTPAPARPGTSTTVPAGTSTAAPAGAQARPAGPRQPNARDIAALKSDPALAAQFDIKFGPGAARRVLGERIDVGRVQPATSAP